MFGDTHQTNGNLLWTSYCDGGLTEAQYKDARKGGFLVKRDTTKKRKYNLYREDEKGNTVGDVLFSASTKKACQEKAEELS